MTIFIVKDKTLVAYKLYQSMEDKESTLFYAMEDFIAVCSGFSLVPWFRAGVSNLQHLMLDHLRWNWCKNSKNKVCNKHNALELPLPTALVCGIIVFHETGPWCQKGWEPLKGILSPNPASKCWENENITEYNIARKCCFPQKNQMGLGVYLYQGSFLFACIQGLARKPIS